MNSYLINASASTSLILAEPSSIVYLSTLNTPGVYITIRDFTGNASTLSTIIVSTVGGTGFADGSSRYTISSSYGYITVQAVDTNTWSLVNTFNTGITAYSVDLLSTKTNTITNTLFGDFISSSRILTSSLGVNEPNPRFTLDINGSINTNLLYQNGQPFILGGNIDTMVTSSLRINNQYIFPSTNLRIGSAQIYTNTPPSINYNTLQFIMYSSLVNAISTVWLTSSGQVGINTSTVQTLWQTNGITTADKVSFPYSTLTQSLSTVIESSFPNYSSFFVNTSTVTLQTDLDQLRPTYSTVNGLNVINAVYVGSLGLNGLLTADKIGVNQTVPTSQFHTSNTVNVSNTITGTTGIFTNTYVSSMSVGRSNASTILDVSGSFLATTGYISTIGVNKGPSYTIDINGSANAQQFFLNGVAQSFVFSLSSFSASSIQTFGTDSNYFLPSTFFNGPTFANLLRVSTITSGGYKSLNVNSFVGTNPSTINTWVAVGDDSGLNFLKYSFDGLNWSNATINNKGTMAGGWTMAFNGKTWLAAFHDASVLNCSWFSSSNGVTWNSNTASGTFPNREMFDLIWVGSNWIGVGQDTRSGTNSNYTIVRSTDGSNWTPATTGGFRALNPGGTGIAYNGYRLVAVGGGSTTNESIQYSDDNGVSWQTISSNGFTSYGLKVATNGSMWVAVGVDSSTNATIKYSYNGITWSNVPSNGFGSQAWCVVWNGSMWVATGYDAASSNTIKYSYNGINWSNAIGGFTAGNIGITASWNGTFWLAGGIGSGNSTMKYSFNGINWSNITSGGFTGQGRAIAYSSNVVPNFQIENLSLFGKGLYNTIYSTNSIFLQTSSLLFNNSLKVSLPAGVQTLNDPTVDIIGPLRVNTLLATSSLSIGNPNQITLFDVQLPSTSGVFSNFPITRGYINDFNASTILTSTNTWTALQALPQSNTTSLGFYFRGGSSGNSNYRVSYAFTNTLFTGQHANLSVDSRLTPSTLMTYVGMIASSADEGYYSVLPNGQIVEDQEAIWITEALPKIKLSDSDMDVSVWGVITNHQNESFTQDGTPDLDYKTQFTSPLQGRIRINGIGEGAMWVTNINGNIANGDYICSSVIPGYGRRQNDDKLHSYTVAKATMSCSFELEQSNYICQEIAFNNKLYRKAFIGCTYHCS